MIFRGRVLDRRSVLPHVAGDGASQLLELCVQLRSGGHTEVHVLVLEAV